MLLESVKLIIGLFLAIKGADVLISSSIGLGRKFKVSDFFIGLVIVGFGTSIPELLVSVDAVLNNSANLSVGNILGSNIANILLVFCALGFVNNIKIKDVLNHTSGVSLSNTLSDEDYTDLNRICRWLENYIPESKPGEKIAYHEVTYGWILGELVERITKKSFQESFIELVKNPLNLSSMKFMTVNNERLPLEIYKHESSNLNTIPTIFKLFALNKIPLISGTCMSKSSDLAMFYNAIINNNTWISKKTKNKILKIYSKGIDHNDNMRNVKLGLGIRFDSEIYFENEIDQPEKSFGHTGLVSCIGWGSIEKNITVSILNNLLLSSELNRYRLNVLSSAIKKDLNTI